MFPCRYLDGITFVCQDKPVKPTMMRQVLRWQSSVISRHLMVFIQSKYNLNIVFFVKTHGKGQLQLSPFKSEYVFKIIPFCCGADNC